MYTTTEIAKIAKLPADAQALAQEEKYASLFHNYCEASTFENLAPGTLIKDCEFFYGTDADPALVFENGYLHHIDADSITEPATFQIFGDDHMLFIQVEGHVILNRIKDAQLPSWESRQPGNMLARLKEFIDV